MTPPTWATCLPSREVALPETTLGEHVVHDYSSISLSLKAHPIAFFRDELSHAASSAARSIGKRQRKGRYVRVAGLVLVRQQPGTAKGVIFITLEDETGMMNVVVWPKVFARNRRTGHVGAVPGSAGQDRARRPGHSHHCQRADRPHA